MRIAHPIYAFHNALALAQLSLTQRTYIEAIRLAETEETVKMYRAQLQALVQSATPSPTITPDSSAAAISGFEMSIGSPETVATELVEEDQARLSL